MPIPASTSKEQIQDLFANSSHINCVTTTKPKKNQFSAGEVCCAFVEFDSAEMCAQAFEVSPDFVEIGGMKSRVQKAKDKVTKMSTDARFPVKFDFSF